MSDKKINSLATIRRDYANELLHEDTLDKCPIKEFRKWLDVELAAGLPDATSMVLSTVDEAGHPDSRVVLLKELSDNAFIFFTNYTSSKSIQMQSNSNVALIFYWSNSVRQVRIRGQVEKISDDESDTYFYSRPLGSQVAAIISPQSKIIKNREFLEQAYDDFLSKNKTIERPDYWGGFRVIPCEMEFFQGRTNRLHDRIVYCRQEDKWIMSRRAP